MAIRPSLSLGTLVVSSLLAASTACRSGSAAGFSSHGDTAFVGVAVGLQNPERYVNVFNGVQLALDELNASRPKGAPVLALRRAQNATNTVQIATQFRDDPSVIGVVGHTESDATINAAAVYDDREHGGRNAIVSVTPTAGAGDVTRASDWVFRVCPVVGQQARTLAQYITDSLHLKRVAIIYRNDVSGREFLRTFAATTDKANATLVERDPFSEDIPEFDLYAKRLATNKPDGLMVFANSSDVLKVLRAVHANGYHPTVVSTNGPSRTELQADAANGKNFAGLRYLALYLPERPLTSTATKFAQNFRAKYSQNPDHWGALSYDAALLIGRAVQAVGTDRRKIRDWIATTGGSRPSLSGATGEIKFDILRNPIDKAALVATVNQ